MLGLRRIREVMPGVLALVCCFGARVAAFEGPEPALNPKSYGSPSGEYRLHVNPSHLHGRGPAEYTLSKNGTALWSATKPFTLWTAEVTDAGEVCGFAYTQGWRGYTAPGTYETDYGEFLVVILDATGNERRHEATKREHSGVCGLGLRPLGCGLVVDPENDRVVVRVEESAGWGSRESWWVYRVSTGKALRRFELEPQEPLQTWPDPVLVVRQVRGTPLMLAHVWRYQKLEEKGRGGAHFALIDANGRSVWHLELPRDYRVAQDEEAEERIKDEIWQNGAILHCDAPRRFDLRFVAENRCVTFEVTPAEDGAWSVKEIARVPYHAPRADTAAPPPIPECRWPALPPLALKTKNEGAPPPVRAVSRFVLDDQGRICFLREVAKGTPALVLVDQEGNVIREIPLSALDLSRGQWTGHAWVGGQRYIVTRSEEGQGGRASGWWVDMGSGEVKAVEGWECPWVDAIEGSADGSFVVLATNWSSLGHTVYRFDPAGRRMWSLAAGGTSLAVEQLFSPDDIAITTAGDVAVIDTILHTVQFFDREGRYLRTFNLQKLWGWYPEYTAKLCADIDGGLLVEDFRGALPLVRMNADGSVRGGLTPRFSDGRTFHIRDFRVAPTGQVWICDNYALLRLAEDGTVDRVLGQQPDFDRLGEIAAVTVGGNGNVYAVASRTGAVHVFDPEGRWIRSCRPEATDFDGALSRDTALTVDDREHVYLKNSSRSPYEENYLHFSAAGERIRDSQIPAAAYELQWYAQPRTGRFWGLGYEEVFLLDESFATVRTITRRPDGNWLESPHSAAVSSNGAIAVIAHSNTSDDDESATVNIYDAEGEPVRTIPLPSTMGHNVRVAYDGVRVVVAGKGSVFCFDAAGDSVCRGTFGRDCGGWLVAVPLIVPGKRELLLFDPCSETPVLQRYQLP